MNQEPGNIKQEQQQDNNCHTPKRLEITDKEKPPEYSIPPRLVFHISSFCSLHIHIISSMLDLVSVAITFFENLSNDIFKY